jgi:phosphoserine phosphatase
MLTGQVAEPVLDKFSKLEALKTQCVQLGIEQKDVLAIGDGANDIPMLKAAGLGVACHAKPNVRQDVSAQINVCGLDALLYVQGYKDDDII